VAITVSGNDIEFTGTVRVINGTNPDTGIAYLILTPDGGVGQIPFLAQGLPGLPPVFDSITVTEVNPGDALLSPGSSGVASHLSLRFYIHKGAQGAIGANVISTASDLAPSPALGASTNGYTLTYRSSDSKWVPTPTGAGGNTYVSPPILATPNNNASPRLLSEIHIPAQPFNWRPRTYAQTVVNGGVLTRVDLVARLNDPATGHMVGFAKGVTSSEPPTSVLIPSYPAGEAVPGTYGLVTAGNAATIFLRAEQKNATAFAWSTPASPDTSFCVEVQPVL
jgi:hypothetical protein